MAATPSLTHSSTIDCPPVPLRIDILQDFMCPRSSILRLRHPESPAYFNAYAQAEGLPHALQVRAEGE
jgi:hypothetical protein